jgi:hypothetical protein
VSDKPDYGPEKPGGGLWREGKDQMRLEPASTRIGDTRVRVMSQTYLDRYYIRKQLSKSPEENEKLYKVGQLYYEIAYRAKISPHYATVDPNRVSGATIESNHAHTALKRLTEANREVGKTAASCLFEVCVVDNSAGDWAKGRGLNSRSGMDFLTDALKSLGLFWKMV